LVWPAARGGPDGAELDGHVGVEGEGPGSGDDGGEGNVGLADCAGVTFRPKYLIQYTPVPGIPKETYRRPSGEIPKRIPPRPTLPPTPLLESVQRNGHAPNTFRKRQLIPPLPYAAWPNPKTI
jgi:hypothetical protein